MSTSELGGNNADRHLAGLMVEKRHLTGLAYRLLGSATDAEDVVQETYARWYAMTAAEQAAIESPGAWLTRVASRICLDQLGSARARRERYVGQWLPEPVPDRLDWGSPASAGGGDPADRVSLDESISMAFLVVLESMTPAERVAFILHDVFRYPFAEVATITGRTPGACRELASAARRRARERLGTPASPAQNATVVTQFKQAWESMDIAGLVSLLDPDITVTSDGGGRVGAELRPVSRPEPVARRFVEIARLAPDLIIMERTVNGRPGLVALQNGVVVTVLSLEVADARVTRIWTVRNPEKLRLWKPSAASLEGSSHPPT